MRAGTGAALAIATVLVTVSCASPAQPHNAARSAMLSTSATPGVCTGFALSLAADHGGQPSATGAAESFTHTEEGTGFPETGWQETGHDDGGVTLSSGASTLHAVQVADGSWFVDSGHQC